MYPPVHHINNDIEKAFSVIDAFPLATVISQTEKNPLVTHVPLMLNGRSSNKVTLIGHMDRKNPQTEYFDNKNILVIFHGPNTYISPTIYQSTQLPTWNYITVHVRGVVNRISPIERIRDSIIAMTEFLETSEPKYKLDSDNEMMKGLLKYIVGFEIEITDIVGRYKLSQDKSKTDMELARQQLALDKRTVNKELISSLI